MIMKRQMRIKNIKTNTNLLTNPGKTLETDAKNLKKTEDSTIKKSKNSQQKNTTTTQLLSNDDVNLELEVVEKKSKYFENARDDETIEKCKMPLNWMSHFENIRKLRISNDAPVDTMGCDKISDKNATPKDQRYQSLLALMLSSQTKDQTTAGAMKKLIDYGCTAENICEAKEDILENLIYPVSFYKTKVRNIKKTTDILIKDWDGDIPHDVENLCKLPGVGPKMAHLAMQCAWGVVTGIAADTHVHRISNRLGWVNSKTPEKTQKQLEEWLPREFWGEVNHLLVGFGQQICLPVRPKCDECLNKSICPSSNNINKKKTSNA